MKKTHIFKYNNDLEIIKNLNKIKFFKFTKRLKRFFIQIIIRKFKKTFYSHSSHTINIPRTVKKKREFANKNSFTLHTHERLLYISKHDRAHIHWVLSENTFFLYLSENRKSKNEPLLMSAARPLHKIKIIDEVFESEHVLKREFVSRKQHHFPLGEFFGFKFSYFSLVNILVYSTIRIERLSFFFFWCEIFETDNSLFSNDTIVDSFLLNI